MKLRMTMTTKKKIHFLATLLITSLLGLLVYLIKAFFICYECFNQGDFTGSIPGFISDLIMFIFAPGLAIYNIPISLDMHNPALAILEWSFWLAIILIQMIYVLLLEKYLFKKKR